MPSRRPDAKSCKIVFARSTLFRDPFRSTRQDLQNDHRRFRQYGRAGGDDRLGLHLEQRTPDNGTREFDCVSPFGSLEAFGRCAPPFRSRSRSRKNISFAWRTAASSSRSSATCVPATISRPSNTAPNGSCRPTIRWSPPATRSPARRWPRTWASASSGAAIARNSRAPVRHARAGAEPAHTCVCDIDGV